MAFYKIRIEKRVYKDLRKIPPEYQKKILQKITQLAHDPRPREAKQLSGRQEYRVRQGVYRILYEIRGEVVEVCIIRVAHRRDVYDR